MTPRTFSIILVALCAGAFACVGLGARHDTSSLSVPGGTCVVDQVEARRDALIVVVEYPDGRLYDVPPQGFSSPPPEGLRFPCSFLPPLPVDILVATGG